MLGRTTQFPLFWLRAIRPDAVSSAGTRLIGYVGCHAVRVCLSGCALKSECFVSVAPNESASENDGRLRLASLRLNSIDLTP